MEHQNHGNVYIYTDLIGGWVGIQNCDWVGIQILRVGWVGIQNKLAIVVLSGMGGNPESVRYNGVLSDGGIGGNPESACD